jgi:hypothetical protein
VTRDPRIPERWAGCFPSGSKESDLDAQDEAAVPTRVPTRGGALAALQRTACSLNTSDAGTSIAIYAMLPEPSPCMSVKPGSRHTPRRDHLSQPVRRNGGSWDCPTNCVTGVI